MSFKKVEEQNQVRPEGRNCILVYGYGKHHFDAITETATAVGIDKAIHLRETHLGVKIQDILDDAPIEATFDQEISDPVIVLSALSDAELHHFLNRFRELGIPRPLFAAVTPTSRHWRFGDLALELGKERREIAAQQKNKQPSTTE